MSLTNDSPQRRKGRKGKTGSERYFDDDAMTCVNSCRAIPFSVSFSDFPLRSLVRQAKSG
jgi:hypothetical protein